MESATEILERQRCLSASFGSEPLLVLPDGQISDLATGYIPLLSTFTTEDKAAKGLRKGKETTEEPVYFSLLELLRDNQILLLTGPTGSGKSTFAKHLSYSLACPDKIAQNATANSETGVGREQWDSSRLQPCYFAINTGRDLEALAHATIPTVLDNMSDTDHTGLVIVVDTFRIADVGFGEHIKSIATQLLAFSHRRHRLLLLMDAGAASNVSVPLVFARYNIKPLTSTQRLQKISQLTDRKEERMNCALGHAASNPALFALAVQAQHPGDQPEALLDAWLSIVDAKETSTGWIEEEAFHQTCLEIGHIPAPESTPRRNSLDLLLLARSRKVRHLLTARHLSTLPIDTAAALFQHNPMRSAGIIQSLLARLHKASWQRFDDLAQALLHTGGKTSQRGALLIARVGEIPAQLEDKISREALTILEDGLLFIAERQDAASVLSRFGDPRDLAALARIPAGTLTLGSNTHPNSQPMHELHVAAFRIGIYPVTIQQYSAFATATSRQWASPDRCDPCKQNFPATDVTWHDAVAYCEWLTVRWRADGTISKDERVRLPSEPEWEKAASGDRNALDLSDACLYPWGTKWHNSASNSEETGLNQPCAVGLFPRACSPYGCHDMTGNVWEWCTTLWGEDMATPSFSYPWQDDGREAAEASPSLRRVLRGGCFSSGWMKANCTYRGSLEPSGYWRGNGFRIVVS